MQNKTWKVGELSKLTRLTVRTLHHYDEIGLLSPSAHTDGGHRLYSELDIVKLQQIMSLKQLGFSLDQIKEMFLDLGYNPQKIINMQIEYLDEEIRLKEELRCQLHELKEVFTVWQKPKPEQVVRAIQLIIGQSKYFTQEQRMQMKKHYDKLNTDEMDELANEWDQLMLLLQAEMEKGTPADAPLVKELAKRWQAGIDLFTGGDEGLIQSAERYYKDNPYAAKGSGMSGELYDYITKALK